MAQQRVDPQVIWSFVLVCGAVLLLGAGIATLFHDARRDADRKAANAASTARCLARIESAPLRTARMPIAIEWTHQVAVGHEPGPCPVR